MNLPKTLLTIAVLLIVLVIATDLSNRTDAQSSAEAYPFQVEHSEFYPEILGHIASKTENPTEDAVVCPTGRLWCDFNYDSILRQYKQKLNYITYFINHIKSSPKTGIFAHNKFLQDINISVSYYAGVSDASTGTNLSSGDTVPVGTELQFSVKPFESEDIEWFATGSFFDSPYGHWIDGAVMPDSRCMPGDRSVHAGWGKYVSYTPLSINPPEYSILHSGTANLACDSGGWNCTVESPGTISSTIVIDET
ncbi:MAG: hypothetical protein MRY49_01980, partial [Candidatus Pacebacteria bacterium]|nr:hypothetical protein [Candidatus Paceibacterota bacterium]